MSYGMFTGALSRGRSTRLIIFALAVTAAAVLAIAIGAGNANAAFVANGYSLGTSSPQAGSHPAITLSASNDAAQADRNDDDLRTLEFELPAGMMLNPKAVPTPCPTTTFNSGTCSAQTKVGTLSVTYRVGSTNYTVAGTVYSITPDADSLINFGFVVNASSRIQKFFFKSGKTTGLTKVRQGLDEDYGLTITIPEIPYKAKSNWGFSTDITISNLTVKLDGRSGFTSYPVPSFVTAPTRCDAADSAVKFLSYLDVTATRTSTYTPTGCNLLSLDPDFNIAATDTTAGRATGMSGTISVPNADQDAAIQPSHVKSVSVDLESGTTVNLNTLNALTLCSEAQLSTDTCPAASKIGTASAAVSVLPSAMTGDIYLTSRDTIQFGYVLRGARGTVATLRGRVDVGGDSYTGGALRLVLETLPQAPWTSATMNFTSKLVNNPKNSCPYATSWAEINGYSGSSSLNGTFYSQTGCAPDTTITSPKPTKTRNRTPIVTFTATPSEGSTFECQVDYAGFAPCASPYTIPQLTEGAHVFSVRAVNGGTPDPSPEQYGFTVDTTPPAVTVTSPTEGQVLTDGQLTASYTTESGAVSYCRVDSGTLLNCTSPITFAGLADGAHTFTLFSRDALGNISTTVRNFSVATPSLPVVDITSPVNRETTLLDRIFVNFTASSPSGAAITKTTCIYYYVYDDPDGEYEGGRRPCTDGSFVGQFDTGDLLRLEVEATDANGQVGVDSVYFTAGVRAPFSPSVENYIGFGRITNRLPKFELTYGDTLYPNATIACSLTLEGAPTDFQPCGTGSNLPDYQVTTPLTDGEWVFRTQATEGPRVGNASAMEFTVGNWNAVYSATTTTQQARAHPDLQVVIDPTEAGQLRSVDVKLPKGLIGSLNSFPKCDDIVTAICPANTKVGDVMVDYQIGGLQRLKPTPGDVYLTGPQDGSDAAGMVIRVFSPVAPFADVIIPLHIQLNNNAQEMRVYSDTIPTLVGNMFDPDEFTEFWVNEFTMNVYGSQGSPYPLLTNPSSCTAGRFSAVFGDTEGNKTPSATIPYQATGCTSLPFEPTITQTFTNPVADQLTGVVADIDLPPGSAAMRIVSVREPPSMAANLDAFGSTDDQCPPDAAPLPSSVFDETNCPPQSIVGTMTVDTPLLPEPLTGKVYLIKRSPLQWLGVVLEGQGVLVKLVGATSLPNADPECDVELEPSGVCQSLIQVTFSNIPDLPISHIRLTLEVPDRTSVTGSNLAGRILSVASPTHPTCTGTVVASTNFISHSGIPPVNASQSIDLTGCAPR